MEVRSIVAIAKALAAADVLYIVVGGIAVNAHGYERFTNDVDLVIGLEPENIQRALHALLQITYHPVIPVTPEDFANAENRRRWHEDKAMLVLKLWSDEHRRTPIDIFIQEPFDFSVELEKVQWISISDELKIPILDYETLIRMKQDAGREKDLLDVSALRKLDPYRK